MIKRANARSSVFAPLSLNYQPFDRIMTTPPEENEPRKSPPKIKQIYKSPDSPTLQPRKIRRQEIMWGVAISAGLLFLLPWFFGGSNEEEEANEQVATLFYQDAAQCEADLAQQQEAYLARQQQYQQGKIAEQPAPPPMKPEDCAAQMEAAKQEHEKTAPVYQTLADCQAEGVQCEAATGNSYRPIYGGTYIDPYYTPSYTYIYYGGIQHRVYEPRTVYLSSNPGMVVTPHGREIAQTTVGRVTAPRHSTFSAPAKPTGTAAKGTIRGRSSRGFGSSFKSTGSGGK
jgi:uncharacterized protein YgiB involved in biofilm formation